MRKLMKYFWKEKKKIHTDLFEVLEKIMLEIEPPESRNIDEIEHSPAADEILIDWSGN